MDAVRMPMLLEANGTVARSVGSDLVLADPLLALVGLLDQPPPASDLKLADGTSITRRWVHGQLHGDLPAFRTHVLITHHGRNVHDAVWHVDGKRLSNLTLPDTVTIIPRGLEGRWDIGGSLEVSHIYLPDTRVQEAAQLLAPATSVDLLARAVFVDPIAARLMQILSDETTTADPAARLFVDQAIDLLCAQLIRAHSSIGDLANRNVRRGLADWQVKKVTAYMREHLEEPVGLEELAQLVSLSRFHFATAFRLATGRSPHQWLVEERIARARELLRSELPITEVALTVGYQTPSSFAAAFRKTVGATPSEYRRAL